MYNRPKVAPILVSYFVNLDLKIEFHLLKIQLFVGRLLGTRGNLWKSNVICTSSKIGKCKRWPIFLTDVGKKANCTYQIGLRGKEREDEKNKRCSPNIQCKVNKFARFSLNSP